MRLSLKRYINELFDDTIDIKKVGDVNTSFTVNLDNKRSVDYTVWIGYDDTPKEVAQMVQKHMEKIHGKAPKGDVMSTWQGVRPYVYDIGFTADKAIGFDTIDIKGAKKIGDGKWDLESEIDALKIGDTKHSLKVFGTVYKVISKWINKYRTQVVGMSMAATTREPSRVKLYRRMAKSMASKQGFEFIGETRVSADSGQYFVFINREFLK